MSAAKQFVHGHVPASGLRYSHTSTQGVILDANLHRCFDDFDERAGNFACRLGIGAGQA